MFYIKVKNIEERTNLLEFLKKNEILSVFHYIPLHSAPAGLKFGIFNGEDKFTTKDSERLLRLPIWYGIDPNVIRKICGEIFEFYK